MMDVPARLLQQTTAKLRVLVVDNDIKIRGRHADLLEMWGCQPVIAEGVGDTLLADAIQKARMHRCQLALVDMHLRDDHDERDWSGLELVPQLAPTVSIIVSASGSREAVRAALKQFDAFSFVGKDEGPEKLLETLEEAVQSIASGPYRPKITWSVRGGSATITKQICSNDPNVPEDAVEEAIGQLFPKARRVKLSLLAGMHDSPSHVPGLRRHSRVFLANDDSHMAARIVKLGRVNKIRNEIDNYKQYVQFNLPAMYRPEKIADTLLWDVGAVAYSYVGNNGLGTPNGPQSFFNFYRASSSTEDILMPLQHFFDTSNWGVYYTFGVTMLDQSLFEAYDASWNGALNREFERWCTREPTHSFPDMPVKLPNATRWITDHLESSLEVENPRQAVTHGDLHADNLFVDNNRAWPIDFERTGPGPILRDFVELIQDIVTRIARFEDRDLPVFYELAIAICAPHQPNEPMRLTEAIRSNEQALKAFQVVQQLQLLAHEHTRYTDRREYLWGLLLHCLFVVRLLPETDPRRTRTLLLAGVLCRRLERWRSSSWPPQAWPKVTWIEGSHTGRDTKGGGHSGPEGASSTAVTSAHPIAAQPGTPQFAQGHALLIGAGGDLPVTAADATALHQILVDPARCAYPLDQVRLLTEERAGRQALLDGLDWLAERVRADAEATVVVYFSGHGVRWSESYLLPHGYDLADLPATAISGAEFTARLRVMRPRKLLVILDCCHAGALGDVKLPGLAKEPLPPELESMLQRGSGRVVIASSRRDEYSYTGSPYSVFTQALVV